MAQNIVLGFLFFVFFSSNAQASPDLWKQWYEEIRTCRSDQSMAVKGVSLVRGPATLQFKSGVIDIMQSAGRRHHTAVFRGEGLFQFVPPDGIERDQLQKFTKVRILEERFKSIVLRFSDDTADEILKANATTIASETSQQQIKECSEAAKRLREDHNRNIDSRILRDLVSDQRGYFLAFVSGETNGQFVFEIDPEEREEVTLTRFNRDFVDTWNSFSLVEDKDGLSSGRSREQIEISHFEVDLTLEKNGDVAIFAVLHIESRQEGLRAVPLNVSSLMEVKEILDEDGRQCYFIHEVVRKKVAEPAIRQEKLDVFFPNIIPKGKRLKIRINLASKDLIERINNGKEYFVRDTTGWYPSYGYLRRSTSKATYRHPSDLQLIAVGRNTKRWEEGGKKCSLWVQDSPVAFISFTPGDFKYKQIALDGLPPVDVYAGKNHSGIRFGGDALSNVAADVVNSLNYFQTVFAPYPFASIAATEIPAFHGQGFPGFLQLSKVTFEDDSLTGIDEAFRAHEVSHQWWGHLVGWETYHDQWISEGFAEYSGALFADGTNPSKKNDLLQKMLHNWKKDILGIGNLSFHRFGLPKLNSRMTMGMKTGPLWLGYRLSSSKSPVDYQIHVYEKGAYVLHMLRMMMRDFDRASDENFFQMIRAFIKSNSWKNATTENFIQIAEQHYGSDLSWFFQQWVYGTEIPRYRFTWRTEPGEGKKVTLVCEVEQTGVATSFRMPVPVGIDFGGGKHAIVRLLVDQPKKTLRIDLPEEPKQVKFNIYGSVLSQN